VTPPLVLLIAVTTNPGAISMARDAATACLEALPAGAKSAVRVAPAASPDVDVVGDAAKIGAAAAVILSWHDASLLTTEVRVFVASPEDGVSHWMARTMVFSARDLPAERGRALGLVIASVLDASWGIAPVDRSPPPTAAVTPPKAAPKTQPPAQPVEPVSVANQPGAMESGEAPPRWALEADVTTATGHWGDVDDSIGGMVALRRSLSTRWALRAGLGFRVADVDGADATARTVVGAAGLVWMSAGFERSHTFGYGARANLLVAHASVQRGDGSSSSSQTESYWSLGGDLLGQVGYGLSPGTALLAGVGVEELLTAGDIYVGGQPAATIPHTQLVLEVGVLSRF
jgi:opacity protein-like surface antigen